MQSKCVCMNAHICTHTHTFAGPAFHPNPKSRCACVGGEGGILWFWLRTCMHAYKYACMHVRTHVYSCIYIHKQADTPAHNRTVHKTTRTHTWTIPNVAAHTYACMHVYMYVNMHACMHACTWTIPNVAAHTGSEKSPPAGDTAPTIVTVPYRDGFPRQCTRPARS